MIASRNGSLGQGADTLTIEKAFVQARTCVCTWCVRPRIPRDLRNRYRYAPQRRANNTHIRQLSDDDFAAEERSHAMSSLVQLQVFLLAIKNPLPKCYEGCRLWANAQDRKIGRTTVERICDYSYSVLERGICE